MTALGKFIFAFAMMCALPRGTQAQATARNSEMIEAIRVAQAVRVDGSQGCMVPLKTRCGSKRFQLKISDKRNRMRDSPQRRPGTLGLPHEDEDDY
jgi:hypothetical protein